MIAHPYKPDEKWDVHTHTTLSPRTHDALARFAHYEHFIRVRAHATLPCCAQMVNHKGEVMRDIQHNAYDGDIRVQECDAHNVSVQVLSPTPMMIPDYVEHAGDAAEICRILNDDNASMVANHPKRFMALGALPMQNTDLAIAELRRIHDELGMRGVEINSNVNSRDLDDEAFFPVFEALADLNMAVFVHPWGGFMSPKEPALSRRMHTNKNWRPWLIGMGMETALAFDSMRSGGVHERLPNLRVMYAHGGGVFPSLLGRLEHGAYCRPDLFENASKKNPYDTIRDCGVYTDTLTHNPWSLKLLIETLGAQRVAMGSDYPYPLGEMDPFGKKNMYPGHMIEFLPSDASHMDAAWEHFSWITHHNDLPFLPPADKARILCGTAKEWLGVAA